MLPEANPVRLLTFGEAAQNSSRFVAPVSAIGRFWIHPIRSAQCTRSAQFGEKSKISLPDGTEFATEICDPGNKLRERGPIRKFYEEAKIADGDKVILKEITTGNWRLLSVSSPEGQELVRAREAKWQAALADLAERLDSKGGDK
jgi:hypothetical protein